MKKIIIFLALLCQVGGKAFAQIFSTNSIIKRIIITPSGMTDRLYSISSTNTGLGENAIGNASTVVNNTGIGSQALQNLGINSPNAYNGNNNTGVGFSAIYQNLQGYDNAALGLYAMAGIGGGGGCVGNSNTAFGRATMYTLITANNNTAFGESAMTDITTANNNTAFGVSALNSNQSSNNHLAFGEGSLQNHTTNDSNTALGVGALTADQFGINNVAIGTSAMHTNISGSLNTGVGYNAIGSNKTGVANVALGYAALIVNDGQNNTTAGYYVFDQNTTGLNNVAIGLNALHANITGSSNVTIGSLAGFNESGSNKLYIDNAITPFTALTPVIGGDFAANKVCIACNMANTGVNDFSTRSEVFQVTGNAFKTLGSGLWIFPSDRRLKTKIVSLNRAEMLSKILMMQGVNYELIANPEQSMQYGFIAQDLRKIFPTKVYENKSGFLSSSYGDYVPMFVEAIKALNEKVVKLEERQFDIKAMTARMEEMERVLKK